MGFSPAAHYAAYHRDAPEGREYYEKARRLLEDLEDRRRLQYRPPKGHLRIAIGGSTARDVLIRCWRTL